MLTPIHHDQTLALAAYRHLLRAARIAFQGDVCRLTAARHEARKGFEANRTLSCGGQEVADRIAHAEDVARILKHNVVQGQRVTEGTQSYKLRIHDQIERGDNESIKSALEKGAASEACWSQ